MHLYHPHWTMETLLYGLPKKYLNKLQLVQNAAARVVVEARKSDRLSMTSVRKNLHWLPIKARIEYKILVIAWKAFNGIGPKYLIDLLNRKQITHNTRLTDSHLLEIPSTKLTTCGDRTFEKAAPLLWNDLPAQIRSIETAGSFKNKLKTHLFTKYYGQT